MQKQFFCFAMMHCVLSLPRRTVLLVNDSSILEHLINKNPFQRKVLFISKDFSLIQKGYYCQKACITEAEYGIGSRTPSKFILNFKKSRMS